MASGRADFTLESFHSTYILIRESILGFSFGLCSLLIIRCFEGVKFYSLVYLLVQQKTGAMRRPKMMNQV